MTVALRDRTLRVVIAGGSGLIGRALVASLVRDGAEVTVLSRDPAGRAARVPAGARTVPWDPADPEGVPALAIVLAGADAVVNVCGVPIGPVPWTPGRMRAIVASRVGSADYIVDALATLEPSARPPAFVCASGTDGYTGLDAEPATEATDTGGTPGFLAQLGRDWEAAAARAATLGVRVVSVRTSFVLARGSPLLRLLALPFRLGFGGPFGNGRQWFSWIHIDDLVAAYRLAVTDPAITGPVNATSPEPCRQRDLAAAMARVLRRPNWFPVPAWFVRLALRGQATLLLGSRRVVPRRLEAAGLRFARPTLDGALRDVLGRPNRG